MGGMHLNQLGNSVFGGWPWNFIIERPFYLKFSTAFAFSLNKLLFASFKAVWVKLILA